MVGISEIFNISEKQSGVLPMKFFFSHPSHKFGSLSLLIAFTLLEVLTHFVVFPISGFADQREFSPVSADSEVLDPASSILKIDASGKTISIDAQNIALEDLLISIQERSGIRFKTPVLLGRKSFTGSASAFSWSNVVRELFRGFNKIEIFGKEKQVTQVWLLEGEPGYLANHTKAPAYASLPLLKLKKLSRLPPGVAVPDKWFRDREFRKYLESNGIHSSKDWMQVSKASLIQRNAQRQLNEILYRQQGRR